MTDSRKQPNWHTWNGANDVYTRFGSEEIVLKFVEDVPRKIENNFGRHVWEIMTENISTHEEQITQMTPRLATKIKSIAGTTSLKDRIFKICRIGEGYETQYTAKEIKQTQIKSTK